MATNRRGGAADSRGAGSQLRVAIIYDCGADDWTPEDVRAVLECVDATAASLTRASHDVIQIPVRSEMAWLEEVRDTDLVFNLCEGVGGVSRLEYNVAAAIELLGIPMTGVSAWTMMLCHRKNVLNSLLEQHGLPVPEWSIAADDEDLDQFPVPAIVKPAAEDASVGIDQGAVVTSSEALRARVERSKSEFGSVIIQRYVAGKEVAVAFVGQETLPISEIDFSDMPEDHWPIVSFAAKWQPGSADYKGTNPVCPADLDPGLADEVIKLSAQAWDVVGGYGYGRVDLRIDSEGIPWILEVNPNPDTSTDAGLANMARAAGWTYDDLVLRIAAVARTPHVAPASRLLEAGTR